ncbi:Alpha/Beta hydrolase protein [Pavlovales sp. CCMP2436]|nr:Alpha/Beta hydrolase protein [Pavlovales sp. CCMP2436]
MNRVVLWATVGFMFRLAAPQVLRVYAPLADAVAEAEAQVQQPGVAPVSEQGGRAGRSCAQADYLPVLAQVLTDYMFRCPARRLAAALHAGPRVSPTFLYEFAQPSNHTPVAACRGLACHTMELPFLFLQPEPPLRFDEDEFALAHAMGDAWAHFARASPGALGRGIAVGSVTWPPWTVEGAEVLELRAPVSRVTGGALMPVCDLHCDFWDSTGYTF